LRAGSPQGEREFESPPQRYSLWACGLAWIRHRPSKSVIAGSNPATSASNTIGRDDLRKLFSRGRPRFYKLKQKNRNVFFDIQQEYFSKVYNDQDFEQDQLISFVFVQIKLYLFSSTFSWIFRIEH
jgi:hypothetical protein